jgi:uncharacterized cupredoxin-like copper-binding protein
MKIARLIALLVAGILVIAGCGEDRGDSATSTSTNGTGTTATEPSTTTSEDSGSGGSGEGVEVGLNEWKVIVEAPSVGAGPTKFEADNEGKVDHELVVLKTDTKASKLPVEGAVAKEEGENLGEASGIAPGEKGEVEVDLETGHYILLCNLPGHYQQGMYADLDVQ